MKYLYSFNSHSDFYNKHMVLEDDNVVLCKDTDINKWHGHYQHPPYDAEIEYLESTGTQWINTGYIMTSRNFEITIVVQWVGNDSSLFETFCGYMKADGINPRSGFHKYTGKWMFGTNTTYTTNTAVDANKHTFLLTGNASTNIESLYIDGVYNSQTTTASTGLSSNDLGMYLFARNRGTTIDNPAKIRIYSFHVVIYNEPAHTTIYGEYDFIPVRVGNVGYMYDRVSGKLFGNSGTGSFILGPDIKPIEYLQSSGTQKIDTGINYNLTSKIKIEMETTIINENRCILISNFCDGNAACISCEVGGTSNSHARTPRFYMSLTNKNTTSDTWAGMAVPLNTLNNIIFEYDKTTGKKRLTSQATTNELVFTGNSYGTTQNLLLFLDHRASPSAIAYGVRIGKVKIYINDNIVRYFIPVRVGSTGYMYDKVSGQLFGNAGTGTFTLGNDL